MEASAKSLLEATQEYSRQQPESVGTTPGRTAIVRTYQADLITQVKALYQYMPILQLETHRRAMVLANVDAVREMVQTYKSTSFILEDVALILFDNRPAQCDAIIAALGNVQSGIDILSNKLDTRRAYSGLLGEAESLLASATQDNEAQTAQLKQAFHSLLESIQKHLKSLEEGSANKQGSAPANPRTFRFKLAKIRTCEDVATKLESLQEILFDPKSEEYGRINTVLDDIQDRTDVLFNDTKVQEFDAEFTSLQDLVNGLEKEIKHWSGLDFDAILPFWRHKHQALLVCNTRGEKLEEAKDELFDGSSDKSPQITAGLSAMEDSIDALITEVTGKIHGIHRRSSIPEEDPGDMELLPPPFKRMSTFGSLSEGQ